MRAAGRSGGRGEGMQHTGLAFLGMELKIAVPAFAGDTLYVEREAVEALLFRTPPKKELRAPLINEND